MDNLDLVETDALLTELAKRYDGMLFAAYATPKADAITWKWWRKGSATMTPFVLAMIERQVRIDLEQLLTAAPE